jgi:hypothetical protein
MTDVYAPAVPEASLRASWSFLDGWSTPVPIPSWSQTEPWVASLQELAAEERRRVARLRAEWDRDLEDLGGDPTAVDWSTFRPLRRDREEDWSDWLAQLVGDSADGAFASYLFGTAERRAQEHYVPESVEREYAVEDRRADLVFRWADGRYTHVEVKVGDPHLEKTPDTCDKVRRDLGCEGTDFVLILPEQENAWRDLRESTPACAKIHMLTWRDVSRALRRTLLEAHESIRWRVWAHALCGTIEDDLLGLRGGGSATEWPASLSVSALRIALDLLNRDFAIGDIDVRP